MKSPWVWAVHEPRIRMLEVISANVSSANATFALSSHVSSANATFALSSDVYLTRRPLLDLWGMASPASWQVPSNGSLDIFSVFSAGGSTANGLWTMPHSPFDGQKVTFTTRAVITTLVVSVDAGQALLGNPVTITAAAPASWRWLNAQGTWHRTT